MLHQSNNVRTDRIRANIRGTGFGFDISKDQESKIPLIEFVCGAVQTNLYYTELSKMKEVIDTAIEVFDDLREDQDVEDDNYGYDELRVD